MNTIYLEQDGQMYGFDHQTACDKTIYGWRSKPVLVPKPESQQAKPENTSDSEA